MTTLTARPLADILADAILADCGAAECWAHHLEPCKIPEPGGVHVARLYRAERKGLITGRELHAVLDGLVVFTLSTVVRAETAVTP